MSETSTEKLALYPKKLLSLVDGGVDYTYPISVPISLTGACNQDCRWCSDRLIRERYPDRLTREVLRNLFQDLSWGGTEGIVLEGGGEPTLSPLFLYAVSDAVSYGLRVGVITNGTRTLPEWLYGQLDWIRISLDASTEEEYGKFKGRPDDYGLVLANIERAARHCRLVGVGYLICRGNHSRLIDVAALLTSCGVDHLHLHPVQDHPDLSVEWEGIPSHYAPGLKIYDNAMTEHSYCHDGETGCLASSITCDIVQSGDVFICNELDQEYTWWSPMGNITQQSFYQIWHGEERRRQLEMIEDPKWCARHCPRCRITKYSALVKRLRAIKTRGFI